MRSRISSSSSSSSSLLLATTAAAVIFFLCFVATTNVNASEIFVAAINSSTAGSPTYFFRVNTHQNNFTTTYVSTYDVDQYGYLMSNSNFDPSEGVVYAATLKNLILKIDVKTGKVLNGQSPVKIAPDFGVVSLEYDHTSKQLYGILSRFFPYVALFARIDFATGSYYTVKNITDEEGYRVLPYTSTYCQKGHRYFYGLQKTISWGPITFKQGAVSTATADLVSQEIPHVIAGLAMDSQRGSLFALHSISNETGSINKQNEKSLATVDIVDTESGAVVKQVTALDIPYQFDGRFTDIDTESGIIYASGFSMNHRDHHFMFGINVNDGSVVYKDLEQFAPQLVVVLPSKN